ncbi:MAG TPA: hypothetical protein VF618_22495 [Thermoanaerobaculia bacterium]
MPDDKEKQTRTSATIGNTEIDRETRTRSNEQQGYGTYGAADRDPGRDRNRGGYDDDYYDDQDDYQDRARRGARDIGDSVRDAGRSVRREGTDFLTAGCDFIGGIFIGIGEAISPRSRGGSSRGCGQVSSPCGGSGGGSYDDDRDRDHDSGYRSSNTGYSSSRPRGGQDRGGRQTTSRTEIRRTTSR